MKTGRPVTNMHFRDVKRRGTKYNIHYSPHSAGLAEGGSEATGSDLSDLLGTILREYFGVSSGGRLHSRNADTLFGLGLELAVLLEKLVRAQEALLQASATLWTTCVNFNGGKMVNRK